MKRQILLLMLGTSMGMGGCSSLTTKEIDQPVVIKSMKENKWFWKKDDYETVLLTPERRQIIIKYGKKVPKLDANNNVVMDKENKVIKVRTEDVVCAEAPSDTGLKIDTLINATLKGEVPAKGSAEAGFGNQSNTANVALHNQLQAIRFMMAASHAICNLYLNGAIDRKEYAKQIGKVLDYTMNMTQGEMALYYDSLSKGAGTAAVAKTATKDEGTAADKATGGGGGSKGGTGGTSASTPAPASSNGSSLYKEYLKKLPDKTTKEWTIDGVQDLGTVETE